MTTLATGALRRLHDQQLTSAVDVMLRDRSYEIVERNEEKQTIRARYNRNDWFTRSKDDLSKPILSSGIDGLEREWVYVNIVWCKPGRVKMNVEWIREGIAQCRASTPPAEHMIVLYDKPITKRIADLSHERDSSAVPLFIRIEIWETKQLLYGITENELVQSAQQRLLTFPQSMAPERIKLKRFLERADHTDAMVRYLGGQIEQVIQVTNRGPHGTYLTERMIYHDKREKVSAKESADTGEL
jgi:hypothetical protein